MLKNADDVVVDYDDDGDGYELMAMNWKDS